MLVIASEMNEDAENTGFRNTFRSIQHQYVENKIQVLYASFP